jgi:hypothetical protein
MTEIFHLQMFYVFFLPWFRARGNVCIYTLKVLPQIKLHLLECQDIGFVDFIFLLNINSSQLLFVVTLIVDIHSITFLSFFCIIRYR